MPAVLLHLALGQFKSEQDAPPDLDSVFDALQAGSKTRPFLLAEVRVGGAGGNDEVVISQLSADVKPDASRLHVDPVHFIHQDFGIGLVAQDAADGLGDVGRRKDSQSHLVEQRLKSMMVAAIYDGHIYGRWRNAWPHVVLQSLRPQSLRAVGAVLSDLERFRQLAH